MVVFFVFGLVSLVWFFESGVWSIGYTEISFGVNKKFVFIERPVFVALRLGCRFD